MNKTETAKLLAILKTSYPNFYKDMSKEEVDGIINLWSMIFEHDQANIVIEAVKSLLVTLKFPPTIADVKEKINLITTPQSMTELEAWGKVKSAMKYYTADEEFDKLPRLLQRLVGSANQLKEWSQMDIDEINTVVASNFQRSYKAKVKAEQDYNSLPESTINLIESARARLLNEQN